MVEKKTKTETVETLQKQMEDNAQKIREMKRADSELNLQLVVGEMGTDEEKPREILTACYSYIAQHRILFKKNKGYGEHLAK